MSKIANLIDDYLHMNVPGKKHMRQHRTDDAMAEFEQLVGERDNAIDRGDRLEAMVDRMSETISECVLLIRPMYELCLQIEKCGASEELTKAVTMASEILHKLMDATGTKQLPPSVIKLEE